jgi:hypothetical protein
MDVPLYFSGITFDWKLKKNGKYDVWNIRHRGRKIKLFKKYKVAFSEGIVRGGFAITKWVGLILKNPNNTQVSMWQAIEEKFYREGDLLPDYLERYYRHDMSDEDENLITTKSLILTGKEMERVMIPGSNG